MPGDQCPRKPRQASKAPHHILTPRSLVLEKVDQQLLQAVFIHMSVSTNVRVVLADTRQGRVLFWDRVDLCFEPGVGNDRCALSGRAYQMVVFSRCICGTVCQSLNYHAAAALPIPFTRHARIRLFLRWRKSTDHIRHPNALILSRGQQPLTGTTRYRNVRKCIRTATATYPSSLLCRVGGSSVPGLNVDMAVFASCTSKHSPACGNALLVADGQLMAFPCASGANATNICTLQPDRELQARLYARPLRAPIRPSRST
jgi:hypothetical protein